MFLRKLGLTLVLAATFALASILPLAPPTYADQISGCCIPGTGLSGGGVLGMSPFGTMGMPGLGMGGLGHRSGLGAALPRGCSSPRPQAPASALADLPRVTVDIHDGLFIPSELTVAPGTVVVFHNRGQQPHSATSWDTWDSGVLHSGQSCAIWAVTPGSYPFLSIVAADGGLMTGVLNVGGTPIGSGPTAGAGAGAGAGAMPGAPQTPAQPAGGY
jgi:plastocyanin